MKVLLLPNNIGSMTDITVKAINDSGNQAIGLILGGDKKQSHRNLRVYPYKRGEFKSSLNFLRWYIHFLRHVLWADVIHWNGSFSIPLLKLTLPIIKFFRKAAIVEFVGSDIRVPQIEFIDNPYFKRMYDTGKYEYIETLENSLETQRLFVKAGFGVLILPGLEQHIDKNFFLRRYKGFQRIQTSEFSALYPKANNDNPLIIHSPSAPVAKGSETILNAVEKLKSNFKFEFKMVNNLSHKEAINILKNSDIFIDQLNGGHYGMASMEAMAFGKPVICYIKDYVLKNSLPSELPIVVANHDNLESKISFLLENPQIRHDIGVQSRNYVNKYHNAETEVLNLLNIYKEEINFKKDEKSGRKV